MPLFDLRTPRDVLAKAQREYQRLIVDVNIDNVFNFLVTAHHITDYVRHSGAAQDASLKAFLADQDITALSDLANTGKHLILDRPPRQGPPTRVVGSYVGLGHVGEMMVGAGDVWFIGHGANQTEVLPFCRRVLQKWESFLTSHGL